MTEQIKPRRDLREDAFRRYETYIARAINGNITVDPRKELEISSATFVARFRDAITAKIRYKYKSSLIGDDIEPLLALKAYELESGLVLIKNTTQNGVDVKESSLSEEAIVKLMQDVANHQYAAQKNQVEIPYRDLKELQHILAVSDMHPEIDCNVKEHQGKILFYTV